MIRHHTLSPLHFYTRAREEPLNNRTQFTSRKQGDLNFLEAGYEEKHCTPPLPLSKENGGGGHWQKRVETKTRPWKQTVAAVGMSSH